MKVKVKKGRIGQIKDQAIILSHFEDQKKLSGPIKAIDDQLSGLISQLLRNKDFVGRLNQTAIIYSQGKLPTPRIILVGLGKRGEFDLLERSGIYLDKVRQAFGSA
jgi:leucyl aminopeptidase